MKKRIALGILAHVDAGKTTLSEGFLYSAGMLDKLGRVDKRDAFLDTHSLERERGITIFSKQAILEFGDTLITRIDTPGHVDFSCETERALSVQDYAVLVISARDGVTAHTKTLWHLLTARGVPTFIFVNKLDIAERRRADLLSELCAVLSPRIVDFSTDNTPEFFETAAAQDERLIAEFFETESLSTDSLKGAIAKRRIFPCFFGSALKMQGVKEFLAAIDKYSLQNNYSENYFGAKVYKVARDPQGKRLTYVKVTGGTLKTKDDLELSRHSGEPITERVEEIRIYSGDKYKSVQSVPAGTVCALLGPSKAVAGDGFGFESSDEQSLFPVLDYRIILPEGANPYESYMRLTALSEEDPSLSLSYSPASHELRIRLMGEIQLEVISRIIEERFVLRVGFDEGAILYKETVADTVYGSGHFEPLRHYAEVHLRIEPLPRGSGIIAATECDVDTLSLNWQRLILTHVEERIHKGILTGSPITDMKITLVGGRAHQKHTEGGDFRQATYRAIRQGLMKAENLLLEPTFDFRAELPESALGRLITDVTNMDGSVDAPEFSGDTAIVTGNAPASRMRSYAAELRAYTRGEGKISMRVGEYAVVKSPMDVIDARGYDPITDERNPSSSVFCRAGAGYSVPWDEADALMHAVPDVMRRSPEIQLEDSEEPAVQRVRTSYRGTAEEDKELMRIFEATYGKVKERRAPERKVNAAPVEKKSQKARIVKKGDEYVIVDGYNFLFAISELKAAAESDIARARDVLVRLLCDYTAYTGRRAIVVFDAYRRVGGEGSVEEIGAVRVVYTKEKETADSYIEKATYDRASEHTVRVVTSDMQEQLVVLGAGGLRVSAREFWAELSETSLSLKERIEALKKG